MNRIHCSYHKCMTVYFSKVFSGMLGPGSIIGLPGYHHFRSHLDQFEIEHEKYRVCSVNNHSIDLSRFNDYRISRFIRDPRDLLVSGYHYHKKGSEVWCNVIDPTESDFKVVNGTIPSKMPTGMSYTQYLNSLDECEGMFAELEFRSRHFDSMLKWPSDDPKILLFKYEDVLGNEVNLFRQIFDFYELNWHEKILGEYVARNNTLEKTAGKSKHIRSGGLRQWKSALPKAVELEFQDRYPTLLQKYDYA